MAVKKKRPGKRGRANALAQEINSMMGKPLLRLGNDPYFDIARIPSGSLTIDRVTGGGFALGRHVEIYGSESSCKSYILYRTMALSQARGNICALIDPEHTFDPGWFALCGGIPDELLLEHPTTAEDAISVMALLAQKQSEGEPIEVVGIDSIATLLPLEEFEKAPDEEPRIAGQARMMSRALRRITAMNQRTLFLWTNQTRTQIGVMFGNPNTVPGGKAMRFYATSRVELRRAEKIKKKDKRAVKSKLQDRNVVTGNYVQVRSEKEKSAIPHREGMFEFDTEAGEIVLESEIINLGMDDGVIERSGNTFTFIDADDYEWRSTSEKDFRNLLRENEAVRSELIESIQDMTIQLSVPRRNGDG